MNRPPTPEEAFAAGASAMQAKIVAVLASSGYMVVAPKILALELPKFQMPDTFVISDEGKKS